MKKFKKTFLSTILISCLFISMNTPLFAQETYNSNIPQTSVYLTSNDKLAFAKKMDLTYENARQKGAIKKADIQVIDKLILQIPLASSEKEKERINKELEKYGVYEFKAPIIEKPVLYSSSSDVTLDTPTIYYSSWEKSWTVTCGGSWKNNNWLQQPLTGNIGGTEGFGVGYTNISQPYKSAVIRTGATIKDQFNDKSVSTSYRSDGDGSKGFGFRMQDSMYNAPGRTGYIGYKWSGSCTYNNWFGSYNGLATAYYIHTYSSAKLNGVSFSADSSKEAGISIDIVNQENSFDVYSNDKPFGIYP